MGGWYESGWSERQRHSRAQFRRESCFSVPDSVWCTGPSHAPRPEPSRPFPRPPNPSIPSLGLVATSFRPHDTIRQGLLAGCSSIWSMGHLPTFLRNKIVRVWAPDLALLNPRGRSPRCSFSPLPRGHDICTHRPRLGLHLPLCASKPGERNRNLKFESTFEPKRQHYVSRRRLPLAAAGAAAGAQARTRGLNLLPGRVGVGRGRRRRGGWRGGRALQAGVGRGRAGGFRR